MKIKMLIELEYDDQAMHGEDEEKMDYFFGSILDLGWENPDPNLILHSNALGDSVGTVRILEVMA